MSLLKIPGILFAVACHLMAFSIPNPHPDNTEVIAPDLTERLFGHNISASVFKIYFCAFEFAECAVIIAHNYPAHPISTLVLSTLIIKGDPGEISITPSFVLGCLLGLTCVSLRRYCYRTLGRLFTFELTIRKEHKLVTTGPYQFVRHPSYTAIYLGLAEIWLLLTTRGSWVRESGMLSSWIGRIAGGVYMLQVIASMVAIPLARIPMEDAMLRKQFGQEWEEWARRVPYALIPGVY